MSFFAAHPGISKPQLFCEPAAEKSDAPAKRFDYIIAGGESRSHAEPIRFLTHTFREPGGTAGCVLASRVSVEPLISGAALPLAHTSDPESLLSSPRIPRSACWLLKLARVIRNS